MASITIRNIEDNIKELLRLRAAMHKRSMEEEARVILGETLLSPDHSNEKISDIVQSIFGKKNGVDLKLPPRRSTRKPPKL